MRHWRWYSKVLFALLVAGFAYFVWPTPWHYPRQMMSLGQPETFRLNRFTGEVQTLAPKAGWTRVVPALQMEGCCPKCGSSCLDLTWTRYHGSYWRGFKERLRIACQDCGYQWTRHPLDRRERGSFRLKRGLSDD